MDTRLGLSVIETAASRTRVSTSQSVGGVSSVAGGRLRSIQRSAVQQGARVLEGRTAVQTSVREGRVTGEGAVVSSVHRYRAKRSLALGPELGLGRGGIDFRA